MERNFIRFLKKSITNFTLHQQLCLSVHTKLFIVLEVTPFQFVVYEALKPIDIFGR